MTLSDILCRKGHPFLNDARPCFVCSWQLSFQSPAVTSRCWQEDYLTSKPWKILCNLVYQRDRMCSWPSGNPSGEEKRCCPLGKNPELCGPTIMKKEALKTTGEYSSSFSWTETSMTATCGFRACRSSRKGRRIGDEDESWKKS